MAKIQLTPAELMSQGTEMEALKFQYENMFKGVENILNDTNSNWSENLSRNFSWKIKTAQNSFDKIIEMLQFGALAAQNSAATFENIDIQLAKVLGASEEPRGAGKGGGFRSEATVPGASRSIVDGIMDEEVKETRDVYIDLLEKCLGISGKIIDNDRYNNGVSTFKWLRTVWESYDKAFQEGADIEDYINIMKDGWNLSGKLLNSEFLKKLGIVGEVIGLGNAEWEAAQKGDFGAYIDAIDDVIEKAGKVGLAFGKYFGLVPKGLAGLFEGTKVLTEVTTIATMGVNFVGDIIKYSSDGNMSLQDWGDTLMDTGVSGGAMLVKGITLGLVDIDVDGAITAYTKNAESIVNMFDDYGCSTGVQCAVGIASAPLVFVGTTAQILLETQPIKLLSEGASWINGKIYSGLNKLF